MTPTNFGTGSLWETVLTYLFTILLFGIFFAALVVPLIWIGSNIKERWHDYDTRKRIRVIAYVVLSTLVLAVALWRGAMPSNF